MFHRLHKEHPENIVKAMITSILCFIVVEVVYGFSLYMLDSNYIVIPIFGCFLILSGFNKCYVEKSFNILVRIWLGFICLIQIPVAIIGLSIVETIISQRIIITITDVFNIFYGYYMHILYAPSEQTELIIYAVICFLIGALKGRVYKFK